MCAEPQVVKTASFKVVKNYQTKRFIASLKIAFIMKEIAFTNSIYLQSRINFLRDSINIYDQVLKIRLKKKNSKVLDPFTIFLNILFEFIPNISTFHIA